MTGRARVNRVLTGDCEVDCVDGCAYPGKFSECSLALFMDDGSDGNAYPPGVPSDNPDWGDDD